MWLRLRQIALLTTDLPSTLEDLHQVLGLEVCYNDPGVGKYGLENALLPIGNTLLEVLAPIAEGTTGGRYIERRGGDGGYMVITQCDDHAPRKKRVEELEIRVVNQFETHEFRNMQMHPRDTGGSFFEIDEQVGPGAHDPDGPWEPAGEHWQAARRLDFVTGVSAVEMQCDDPEAIAKKWGEIAQLPVAHDARGANIAFQNANAYFVPITDGRPEGLSAMDLTVANKAKVLAAAKARGAYRTDDQIYLCGMRINLI